MVLSINTEFDRQQTEALFRYKKPEKVLIGGMYFSEAFAIKNAGLNIVKIYNDPEMIYRAICWAAD